ncbi:hypothetical protein [Parasitella parasitica]|uniref:Nudix hydrolase domain-containing protein n=1 Tax=Parasitella parasitica TaxID=35722 RepID=A0A0B7NI90_9FUNG|nr:hypothetical protein [Parasitella parasitica]
MKTKISLDKELVDVETYLPKLMGKGEWLQLECLPYKDNAGIERKWERCVRRKEHDSSVDGLIDAGEKDPILSAQRELKEETGYDVPASQFDLVKLPLAYEPGLSNSCCYIAKVTIDATKLSAPPIPALEADEWSLQTVSIPLDGLLENLRSKWIQENVF